MNIKKLIVPIVALVIVIAALVVGVTLINKPEDKPKQITTNQAPQSKNSMESQVKDADAALNRGDYTTALSLLEKARIGYQDQNKKREADEINDKIESIKALQTNQKTNTNADKIPAPIAE